MKALAASSVAVLLVPVALGGCAAAGAARPGPRERTPYLRAVHGDLAEAAHGLAGGGFSLQRYLDVTADRSGKARRFRDDPAWRAAAAGGADRDGDRVPDVLDACPDTPRLTATDERGCPKPPADCESGDPRCLGPDDDRRAIDLLTSVTFLFDPACDGSPVPQTPQPLEWGRNAGTSGSPPGLNLAVTRVDNQRPGCSLFYELQFRIEQAPPPTARYLNVLFEAAEDLSPGNPRRAVFNLPAEGVPLPAQRHALRHALLYDFLEVQWRVRAVNGAHLASPWSGLRTQGPASGGVSP